MSRFLLVHGAFGGAWCWEPVIPGLRAAGHDAQAIDLPGAGQDPTPLGEVSLAGYAQRICAAPADGPPALLTGQSMGGMAITQAAALCPERIAGLVYVSAFLPPAGQSLIELTRTPEAAGDQGRHNCRRRSKRLTKVGPEPTFVSSIGRSRREQPQLRRPLRRRPLARVAGATGQRALAPAADPSRGRRPRGPPHPIGAHRQEGLRRMAGCTSRPPVVCQRSGQRD
jgi:pimeloyl-ACP methyl ester carboxylesterase